MSFLNYREGSRKGWGREIGAAGEMSREEIGLGCMLRIADATELMAKNHDQLVRQRDHFERDANYWRGRADKLQRQLNSTKGVVTKLRKKQAAQS